APDQCSRSHSVPYPICTSFPPGENGSARRGEGWTAQGRAGRCRAGQERLPQRDRPRVLLARLLLPDGTTSDVEIPQPAGGRQAPSPAAPATSGEPECCAMPGAIGK